MTCSEKRTFLSVTSIVIACATVLALFSSCDPDLTILTEYEGVNLIANKGFDSADWLPDQDTTYMVFEEVTGVTLPAGVTDSAVCRLEIKNLVEDGDFEQSNIGNDPIAPAWSTTGTGDVEVADIAALDGKCLLFNVPASSDTVQFDLSTLLDGYPESSSYILRFDFKANEANIFWYYFPTYNIDSKEKDLHTADVSNASQVQYFPDDFEITTSEFTSATGLEALYITGKVQTAYMDDFRIVRTDIPLRLRISLQWADPERPGGLRLVSGWYQFSVWVRSDPEAAITNNRFSSDDISIGIENEIAVFPDTDAPLDMNGWAQVSTTVFLQIDAPADPTADVLELSISPTDIKYANERDVGSLLITAPSLELYSSNPLSDD